MKKGTLINGLLYKPRMKSVLLKTTMMDYTCIPVKHQQKQYAEWLFFFIKELLMKTTREVTYQIIAVTSTELLKYFRLLIFLKVFIRS